MDRWHSLPPTEEEQGAGPLLLFFAALLLGTGGYLYRSWDLGRAEGPLLWIRGGLLLGLALAGLLFLLAYGVHRWERWVAPPPQLEVSAHPLRVGETVRWRFLQPLRRPPIPGEEVWMELVLREDAVYRRGTERVHLQEERVAASWPVPGGGTGGLWVAEGRLTIPREGMHTFRSEHHRIRWILRVVRRPPETPEALWTSFAYELEVAPEVAPPAEGERS